MILIEGDVVAHKKAKLSISANKDGTFTLEVGAKSHGLTFEQMFSYAHSCLNAKKYATASQILKVLGQARNADRQVKIMLAHCAACVDRYDTCQEMLKAAFGGKDDAIVEKLHAAFVYESVRMQSAAIGELTSVITDFRDLPTACLILGDLFARVGKTNKATSCWKLAVKRDQPGGSVAVAAKTQLARLRKRTEPTRKKNT